MGCGTGITAPFLPSTKNMNNTWPWLLDTWTWLVNWWAFGSLGHFIPPLSLLSVCIQAKNLQSRSSTVEWIHSATFSISCKRFALFCQIDLNNFVLLHFPTFRVFFCNHLAARLNLISSATFSICCNLCLQISIGNIPFCRNDPLRYLFHILYTFCIFLSNRLEKFYSAIFSNLLCLFCNFLASRLNLTSSATFSNGCNLFCKYQSDIFFFVELINSATFFTSCICFASIIDLNGKKYILLSFPLAASICTAVLTVFFVNNPICT